MRITKALLLIALIFGSTAVLADRGHQNRVHGMYLAQLDLNKLGIERIEAMAFILHPSGTVSYVSEHEPNDLGPSGLGVWEHFRNGKVGIGVVNYRMGVEGVCQLVGAITPDNCVLKLGALVERTGPGSLEGILLLTVEGPGPTVNAIPVELPIKFRRMKIREIPGAFPAH